MEFEWDNNKNKINIEKHKISFEEAIEIFKSPIYSLVSNNVSRSEKRIVSKYRGTGKCYSNSCGAYKTREENTYNFGKTG